MIVLPAEHTRRFGLSYKPIEVRQAAARHEFVGFFDDATEPEIEVAASFPPGAGRAEANLNFHVSAWPGPQVIEAHDAITRRHIHRLTLSSDPCGPPLRI